jgi:hypothetical protein
MTRKEELERMITLLQQAIDLERTNLRKEKIKIFETELASLTPELAEKEIDLWKI